MCVNYTRMLLFFNLVPDIAYTWLQYELFTGLLTDVSLQILHEIGHFCLTAWSERSFVRPLILSMIQRVKLWYTTRAVVSELLEAEFFTIDYDKGISHLQECLVQFYWRSAVLLRDVRNPAPQSFCYSFSINRSKLNNFCLIFRSEF